MTEREGEEEGDGGSDDGDDEDDPFVVVDLQVRRGWSDAARMEYDAARKRFNEQKRMKQPGKRAAKNQADVRRVQSKRATAATWSLGDEL